MRAEIDDLSLDAVQPWAYDPITGIWVLPPASRFINTLLVTVRVTTATAPLRFTGRLLSWQGNADPPAFRFSSSSTLYVADATVVRPANDDAGSAQTFSGNRGSISGRLDNSTSVHTMPLGGAPAVVDIPGLPPKNYRSVWFTFDAACSGSLTLDFSTPTFNRLRTDALRVYDATGVLVFGTKRSDPFPTGRGTFVVSPGRYTIAAYYDVRALADTADVFGTSALPYTFSWTFTGCPPP